MTENNVKQTPKQLLWTCAAIVLGNFLLAFAVAAFIIPSGVIMGGATGVGIIITHFIPLDTAAVIFVLNMLALAMGYIVLGKGFAVKTVASSIFYPMFLKVVQSIPGIDSLTDDWLLSVLLSGALVGVALGLVMRVLRRRHRRGEPGPAQVDPPAGVRDGVPDGHRHPGRTGRLLQPGADPLRHRAPGGGDHRPGPDDAPGAVPDTDFCSFRQI